MRSALKISLFSLSLSNVFLDEETDETMFPLTLTLLKFVCTNS